MGIFQHYIYGGHANKPGKNVSLKPNISEGKINFEIINEKGNYRRVGRLMISYSSAGFNTSPFAWFIRMLMFGLK